MRNRIHIDPGAERSVARRLFRKVGAAVKAMADSPVHPLGPPTVAGTAITVDTMLNQPTRVTRMIMDLTLQRFIADRIFSSGGGVTGGAVIYDRVQANELYTNRDVERIAPGGEFPLIHDERLAPSIAEVEKWGGKVFIPDESRDRNDSALFTNRLRRLANTIVRKINARAIQTLDASIAASGNTIIGRNWSVVTDTGPDASQTTRQNMPFRDFALAARLAEEDELGIRYDLWLLNPQEYSNLIIAYGADGLRDVLNQLDIDIFVSNRVPAGTAYVVASGQVGQMRVEKPLGTETWREQATERTWVQSSVRPLMFVDNDFAVLQFTGLAG